MKMISGRDRMIWTSRYRHIFWSLFEPTYKSNFFSFRFLILYQFGASMACNIDHMMQQNYKIEVGTILLDLGVTSAIWEKRYMTSIEN